MKKLFLLLVLSLFVASPFVAFADDDEQTPPPPPPPQEEIVFGKPLPNPDSGKINPESLIYGSITGEYCDGCVWLNFEHNFGTVDVTIVNVESGRAWFSSTDSSVGSMCIAIGLSTGLYTVTVETQTDGVYIGEFTL